MIKTFVTMLAFCFVLACSPECPKPPDCPDCPPVVECDSCCEPCPETLVCPDGYELEKEPLEWECEKISEAQPKDYIKLNVGAGLINAIEVDSRTDIYVGVWVSCRNPNDAATYCASLIQPTFDMSAAELRALAAEGCTLLDEWEGHWRENLSTENKRAAKFPKFEGYSNVKKEYWQPFEDRLRAQKTTIDRLTQIAQDDPLADCAFDNLAGWCECRRGLIH